MQILITLSAKLFSCQCCKNSSSVVHWNSSDVFFDIGEASGEDDLVYVVFSPSADAAFAVSVTKFAEHDEFKESVEQLLNRCLALVDPMIVYGNFSRSKSCGDDFFWQQLRTLS